MHVRLIRESHIVHVICAVPQLELEVFDIAQSILFGCCCYRRRYYFSCFVFILLFNLHLS